jgi:hypothetical protein
MQATAFSVVEGAFLLLREENQSTLLLALLRQSEHPWICNDCDALEDAMTPNLSVSEVTIDRFDDDSEDDNTRKYTFQIECSECGNIAKAAINKDEMFDEIDFDASAFQCSPDKQMSYFTYLTNYSLYADYSSEVFDPPSALNGNFDRPDYIETHCLPHPLFEISLISYKKQNLTTKALIDFKVEAWCNNSNSLLGVINIDCSLGVLSEEHVYEAIHNELKNNNARLSWFRNFETADYSYLRLSRGS